MIYLELFLAFFEIGLVSFGGGYGMLSMIREKAVGNGWLTESGFMDLIAIAESTPGPIAVNSATFIGSLQGGLLGSLIATLGVVLPAFLIILLIASVMTGLMKLAGVKAFLSGVRPTVVGLIIATGISMICTNLFALGENFSSAVVDFRAIAIFAILFVATIICKKLGKKIPPILLIVISAVLGMIIYSI